MRTPSIKGNNWSNWGSQWWSSSIYCYLPLVEWLLGQWGILKHFPQSRCIYISHWSREKKQSSIIIWLKWLIFIAFSGQLMVSLSTLVSLLLFSCCNDSFPLLKHGCRRLLSLSLSSNSTTSCFRAPTKIVRSCQGESPGGGLLVSRQGARSLSQAGTSGGRGGVVIICELGTRFSSWGWWETSSLGVGGTLWRWSELLLI